MVVGGLVVILLLAAFALPLLFKDRIKQAVDEALEASINAEINYGDFDLSLFQGFPNLSVSVNDLSVIGNDRFEGDSLISTEKLSIAINPVQAIFSDKLEIKSIEIFNPRLQVLVLEDGTANYQIAKEDSTAQQEDSNYQFGIDNWLIENGTLIYKDDQTGFNIELNEVNHRGSGNFSQDIFDLNTSSTLHIVDLQYQNLSYVSDKKVVADVILEMDLPTSTYKFKQNEVSINEFSFGFDGWLSMPEASDDILMDISFATKQNDFSSLLSCIPGMYTEEFENIQTDGLVSMIGKLDGTYNTSQIPKIDFSLNVEDGMFHYPDLPTAVDNINFDLNIVNSDGLIDNTLVNIQQLSLNMGDNPLNGSLKIDGFDTPEIDAKLAAAMDLSQLSNMIPMDGTMVTGDFGIDLEASGIYDSAAQTFPRIDADLQLNNGYIKSDEFPESLENIHINSTITNNSGHLPETRIEVPDFSFSIDNEKFGGNLVLVNPNNFSWDMAIAGGVDLEKIDKILSLEDMSLKGKLRGSLTSAGNMSNLEAENYAAIPTSGDFEVENFYYQDEDLSHPLEIRTGRASFSPNDIKLVDIEATTGSSDFGIDGMVSNYLNFLLKENAELTGSLVVQSQNIDLNEWMTESSEDESEPLSVLEIPDNLDLDLRAEAGKVDYDNMELRNLKGQILIKNAEAKLRNLSFNSLGGGFLVNGSYQPADLKHPKYELDVEMQQVGFKEAFNSFNTVKAFAPVAQFLQGKFSSNFSMNGELQPDMMPNLSTVSLDGLVNIATAILSAKDSKLVQGLSGMTQFESSPKEFSLEDVIMAIKINNGQMEVAPFSANFGEYQTMVSGSTGIDGKMNFLLNMELPAGVVGKSVNQGIANLTGNDQPVDDKVNLNIKLAGSYLSPSFGLDGLQSQNTTAGQAKYAVDQKKQEVKDSLELRAEEETQKITEAAQQGLDSLLIGNSKDSTTNTAIQNATKELVNKDKVNDVLNLFKKKKKTTVDNDSTKDSENLP